MGKYAQADPMPAVTQKTTMQNRRWGTKPNQTAQHLAKGTRHIDTLRVTSGAALRILASVPSVLGQAGVVPSHNTG